MRMLLILGLLLAPSVCRATVVLELFTSQSCSSCPPADRLLAELAQEPGVLALSLHVDYWNRTGWKDPFSSAAYTARQRQYAAALGDDSVYTPELVVNGTRGVVGSDRSDVWAAVTAARTAPDVPIRLVAAAGGLQAALGGGQGPATVWLAGYDPKHTTTVGGGENGGRTLVETNVVRSLQPVGSWTGAPMTLTLPRPAGERAAVFLQRADGRILGGATLP